MTVVSLVVLEKVENGVTNLTEYHVDGYSYSPIGNITGIESNVEVKFRPLGAIADIAAVSSLCNDAVIIGNDHSHEHFKDTQTTNIIKKGSDNEVSSERKMYERVGEPTEAALCVLGEKLGGMSNLFDEGQAVHAEIVPSILANCHVKSWRELHPRVATLEFNRDRKSMSVLCNYQNKLKSRQNGNRLLVKGAPNLLIERCTHIKYRDGNVVRMSGRLRRDVMAKVNTMSARPLRCIALAVKDSWNLDRSLKHFSPIDDRDIARHPLLKDSSTYSNIESGLTLVGIVGIKDPARPGVAQSMDMCSKAGIRVIMITGDAKDTAVAIARDVRIFPPENENDPMSVKAFEGREFFEKPSEEQLKILAKDNIVFCRTEPSDKQKLIKMLQSLGEVTCMTGDGVVSTHFEFTTWFIKISTLSQVICNVPFLFITRMMHLHSNRRQ
jgi:P-type Ca2+ transporter type 2C